MKKRNKDFILAVLLAVMVVFVLGGIIWVYFTTKGDFVSKPETTTQETQETIYLTWKFVARASSTDYAPSTSDQPLATVVLVLSGAQNEEVALVTFPGCGFDTRQSKWDNAPGAIITAICWWAGSGDEISVHRTAAHRLTVRRREIDEQSGWGPFTDIKEITIPPSINVVPGPMNQKSNIE